MPRLAEPTRRVLSPRYRLPQARPPSPPQQVPAPNDPTGRAPKPAACPLDVADPLRLRSSRQDPRPRSSIRCSCPPRWESGTTVSPADDRSSPTTERRPLVSHNWGNGATATRRTPFDASRASQAPQILASTPGRWLRPRAQPTTPTLISRACTCAATPAQARSLTGGSSAERRRRPCCRFRPPRARTPTDRARHPPSTCPARSLRRQNTRT